MAWKVGRYAVYAGRGYVETAPHVHRLRRQWFDVYEVGGFGFRLSIYRLR